MTTEYDILIKAPELSGSAEVADELLELGASEVFESENQSVDVWIAFFSDTNLLGEITDLRSDHEIYRETDFEFGYDFRISFPLRFADDTPETRQSLAMMASSIGRRAQVLLTYNSETTILANDTAGDHLYRPLGHDASYYVSDWVRTALMVLRSHGYVLRVRSETVALGDVTLGERHDFLTEDVSDLATITNVRTFGKSGSTPIEAALRRCFQRGQDDVTLDAVRSQATPRDLYRALLARAADEGITSLPSRIRFLYTDATGWWQVKVVEPAFLDRHLKSDRPH